MPLPTNEIAQIRWALRALDMGKDGEDYLDVVKTALKDGISYVHGQAERNLIEDDLQVSRLNALLVYVVVGLALLMAAVPFVSRSSRPRRSRSSGR
ncbi:hypothetical protein ACIBL3_44545 [Kribbella sp. NPDC050124]|uniref:hypothetical protein n=1 Tax=Kribbella sp. NPDC050124 TaxID=3364114 RepID=UPI0037872E56